MPIQVSGAFHTPLMQGARAPLRKALAEVTFLTPEVRVVANVDAHVHDDPADWPGLLSAQLCSPVRWRQTLETFAGLGLTSLVELGPGGVLSGLAKRSLPEIQSLSVSKPEDLDTLMDQVGAAGTWRAEPALHQGEHLYMSERVVVSPCSGIFYPESSLQAPGTGLLPGTGDGSDAVVVDRGRRPGGAGRRRRGAHALRRRQVDPLAGGRRRAGPRGTTACLAPSARHRADGRRARHRRDTAASARPASSGSWPTATRWPRPTGRRRPLSPPEGAGDRFLPVRCDVRNGEDVEAAFAAIEERWGPVEVLVANAGITRDSLMLRMSDQAFLDVIDANLTGSFRVAKRAVAKMLRLHTGRIIFVSSVGAFVGLPGPGQLRRLQGRAGRDGPGHRPRGRAAARSRSTSWRPA